MRSVEGIVALREIARNYGPVQIAYEEGEEPWTVRLVGHFDHETGPTLQEAAAGLLNQLEGLRPQ